AIDLCGGIDPRPGFIPVDLNAGIGVVEADLNRPWPIATNSVGVIRAMDALEHLRDPIHVMNEAYRVLVHGGFFLIEVPSSDGRGAFQDPTHVSFWNENSFWYYCDRNYQRYITGAGASCRFQVLRLRTYFPNEFCRERNIPYVQAHLVAIKDGPRFHGALMI
ncbi:MAG: methyltransferase domain-containing protein, partial [Blastocatellia bacterium]